MAKKNQEKIKCWKSLNQEKLEMLENMMKKVFFREKKRFHLLKSLYKNGKAQNMPVVAGRLVFMIHLNAATCLQFKLLAIH